MNWVRPTEAQRRKLVIAAEFLAGDCTEIEDPIYYAILRETLRVWSFGRCEAEKRDGTQCSRSGHFLNANAEVRCAIHRDA